jgi:hypothetical protein
MNITAVLQAMAIRFFVPSGPFGFLPEIVEKIKSRYSFVGAPTLISEYLPTDPNQGTLFRIGRFVYDGRDIAVSELHLFHLGAGASTNSSTDDSDLFLDDLMTWLSSELQVTFTEHGERAYSSQLEFQLNRPLPDYFPELRSIGLTIPQVLPKFWLTKPPYEVTGVTFSFDPATRLTGLGNVRIERRQGIVFDSKLYFSEAPLKTRDHRVLLEQFEEST